MTSFKTTKVVDKLIADGWKLEIVPVQHMFPNCNIRYHTKCIDMKSCDKDMEGIFITFPAKYGDYTLMTAETIKEEKERLKPPKDFQDDIQRAKKMKFEK